MQLISQNRRVNYCNEKATLLAMGSMSELWDERQIQILVLLSFGLQVFLFFAGSTRYRSRNAFLRFLLWMAYLGADAIAVYVLGLLSRQQDANPSGGRLSEIHPLAFIWAPFLLIHLGGQDTITAFAIEDNNLWLRHFLNLVLQVGLALYVFWKSTVWRNVHLLETGVFLFLSGILKYGERTMALKYGVLKSLANKGQMKQKNVQDNFLARMTDIIKRMFSPNELENISHFVIPTALRSASGVRNFFGGLTSSQMFSGDFDNFKKVRRDLTTKKLEVQLRLMYDDLYTKAQVLRTRIGIIVRCISQVSTVIALVLFFTISDKQRYSRVDVAITYTLFVGGICLEVCAVSMMVTSAWTWGWLEAQKCRRLAGMSLWLLLSRIGGLPEERTLWSNSMGQYHFFSYVGAYDGNSMMWWKQQVMKTIRAMKFFRQVKRKGILFWFSKLLDTTEVTVDCKEIMESISQEVIRYKANGDQFSFPHLSPMISKSPGDFDRTIIYMHIFTAVHLSKYPSASYASVDDIEPKRIDTTMKVCQKLSNYMFYLFAKHPEMLPTNGSAELTLDTYLYSSFGHLNMFSGNSSSRDKIIDDPRIALRDGFKIQPCEESLEELQRIWIRFLMYAAAKSRPEMHAALLARGGELLTFVWLHMLHYDMGDMGRNRIELFGPDQGNNNGVKYLFPAPESRPL